MTNLYRRRVLILLMCLVVHHVSMAENPAPSPIARTLTDVKGRKLEGTLLSVNNGQVRFRRSSDRREVDISIHTLSAGDREFILRWRATEATLPAVSFDDAAVASEIEKFFENTFVVDGVMGCHIWDAARGSGSAFKDSRGNHDFRGIKRASGINVSLMTVSTLRSMDVQVERIENGTYENVRVIRSFADIERCRKDGRHGILMYKQSQNWPESGIIEMPMLSDWKQRGLRVFQIAYGQTPGQPELTVHNRLGHAGNERGGLTDLGRQAISELNRLNLIVDVSHCNDQTVIEACELSTTPVIASHSNVRAVTPLSRNKSDAALQAIGRSGGIIGITPVAWMFRDEETGENGVAELVNHMDHVVSTIGIDHLAVASDSWFNGWSEDSPHHAGPVLSAPDRWKAVAIEMRRRGYSLKDLEKVFSTNWLRVLEAALE